MIVYILSVFAQLSIIGSLYASENAHLGDRVASPGVSGNDNNETLNDFKNTRLINEIFNDSYFEGLDHTKDVVKRNVQQSLLNDVHSNTTNHNEYKSEIVANINKTVIYDISADKLNNVSTIYNNIARSIVKYGRIRIFNSNNKDRIFDLKLVGRNMNISETLRNGSKTTLIVRNVDQDAIIILLNRTIKIKIKHRDNHDHNNSTLFVDHEKEFGDSLDAFRSNTEGDHASTGLQSGGEMPSDYAEVTTRPSTTVGTETMVPAFRPGEGMGPNRGMVESENGIETEQAKEANFGFDSIMGYNGGIMARGAPVGAFVSSMRGGYIGGMSSTAPSEMGLMGGFGSNGGMGTTGPLLPPGSQYIGINTYAPDVMLPAGGMQSTGRMEFPVSAMNVGPEVGMVTGYAPGEMGDKGQFETTSGMNMGSEVYMITNSPTGIGYSELFVDAGNTMKPAYGIRRPEGEKETDYEQLGLKKPQAVFTDYLQPEAGMQPGKVMGPPGGGSLQLFPSQPSGDMMAPPGNGIVSPEGAMSNFHGREGPQNIQTNDTRPVINLTDLILSVHATSQATDIPAFLTTINQLAYGRFGPFAVTPANKYVDMTDGPPPPGYENTTLGYEILNTQVNLAYEAPKIAPEMYSFAVTPANKYVDMTDGPPPPGYENTTLPYKILNTQVNLAYEAPNMPEGEKESQSKIFTAQYDTTRQTDIYDILSEFEPKLPLNSTDRQEVNTFVARMMEIDSGYFTTFVTLATEYLAKKNSSVIDNLTDAFLREFHKVIHNRDMAGSAGASLYGYRWHEAMRALDFKLTRDPPGVVKFYANVTHKAMRHRSEALSYDLNMLLTFIDSLYTPSEGTKLAHVAELINNYPHDTSYSADYVMNRMVDEVFVNPFTRLGESIHQKLLVDAVNGYLHKQFSDNDEMFDYRRDITRESPVNVTNVEGRSLPVGEKRTRTTTPVESVTGESGRRNQNKESRTRRRSSTKPKSVSPLKMDVDYDLQSINLKPKLKIKTRLRDKKSSLTDITDWLTQPMLPVTHVPPRRKHFKQTKRWKPNTPKVYRLYLSHHKKFELQHERARMHKYDKMINDYMKKRKVDYSGLNEYFNIKNNNGNGYDPRFFTAAEDPRFRVNNNNNHLEPKNFDNFRKNENTKPPNSLNYPLENSFEEHIENDAQKSNLNQNTMGTVPETEEYLSGEDQTREKQRFYGEHNSVKEIDDELSQQTNLENDKGWKKWTIKRVVYTGRNETEERNNDIEAVDTQLTSITHNQAIYNIKSIDDRNITGTRNVATIAAAQAPTYENQNVYLKNVKERGTTTKKSSMNTIWNEKPIERAKDNIFNKPEEPNKDTKQYANDDYITFKSDNVTNIISKNETLEPQKTLNKHSNIGVTQDFTESHYDPISNNLNTVYNNISAPELNEEEEYEEEEGDMTEESERIKSALDSFTIDFGIGKGLGAFIKKSSITDNITPIIKKHENTKPEGSYSEFGNNKATKDDSNNANTVPHHDLAGNQAIHKTVITENRNLTAALNITTIQYTIVTSRAPEIIEIRPVQNQTTVQPKPKPLENKLDGMPIDRKPHNMKTDNDNKSKDNNNATRLFPNDNHNNLKYKNISHSVSHHTKIKLQITTTTTPPHTRKIIFKFPTSVASTQTFFRNIRSEDTKVTRIINVTSVTAPLLKEDLPQGGLAKKLQSQYNPIKESSEVFTDRINYKMHFKIGKEWGAITKKGSIAWRNKTAERNKGHIFNKAVELIKAKKLFANNNNYNFIQKNVTNMIREQEKQKSAELSLQGSFDEDVDKTLKQNKYPIEPSSSLKETEQDLINNIKQQFVSLQYKKKEVPRTTRIYTSRKIKLPKYPIQEKSDHIGVQRISYPSIKPAPHQSKYKMEYQPSDKLRYQYKKLHRQNRKKKDRLSHKKMCELNHQYSNENPFGMVYVPKNKGTIQHIDTRLQTGLPSYRASYQRNDKKLDIIDEQAPFYTKVLNDINKIRKISSRQKYINDNSNEEDLLGKIDEIKSRLDKNIPSRRKFSAEAKESKAREKNVKESRFMHTFRNTSEQKYNVNQPINRPSQHVKKPKVAKGRKEDNNPNLRKIIEASSYSDEEYTLKLNLEDAMLHPEKPTNARKSYAGGHDIYTDEETVLKSRLYESLGISPFKSDKTMHNYI